MKTLGLALGGGGLRGLAHIGVLQVLEEHQIKPAFITGTSAGSIFAAFYACGISPFRMEEIVKKIRPEEYLDYNIMGIIKYLVSLIIPGYETTLDGFIKGKKLERLIYTLTGGKKMFEVSMPLGIISCDINTGKKTVFSNQFMEFEGEKVLLIQDALVSEAVRSSISIPATFEPMKLGSLQMVDGGLKDVVPAFTARVIGADYVLAVNLGQETYDKGVEGMLPIISRSISILTYETSDTEEKLFADMMIFPNVGNVGLDDIKDAPRIIRAGRRAMREHIDELIKNLNEGTV